MFMVFVYNYVICIRTVNNVSINTNRCVLVVQFIAEEITSF